VPQGAIDRDDVYEFLGAWARHPTQLISAPGKTNGLYWPAASEQDASPIGPDALAMGPDTPAADAFYGYHYPGVAGRGLYVVKADGTGLTLVMPTANGSTSRLAWSPDGSMIAFAAIDDARPIDGARGYVYVVDVATGRVSVVSSSDVETEVGAPLAWRPGGTELLYAQSGAVGREDVVLAERVGDTWRTRPLVTGITRGDVANAVMWLDAERFAYVRDDRLFVGYLDGRPGLPIGEPDLRFIGPGCVAPDGSAVAVETGDIGESMEDNTLLVVPTDGRPSITAFTGGLSLYGAACSWQAVSR